MPKIGNSKKEASGNYKTEKLKNFKYKIKNLMEVCQYVRHS